MPLPSRERLARHGTIKRGVPFSCNLRAMRIGRFVAAGGALVMALASGGCSACRDDRAEAPAGGLYARSSRFAPALIIEGGLAGKVPADPAEWEEKAKPRGPDTERSTQEDKKGS